MADMTQDDISAASIKKALAVSHSARHSMVLLRPVPTPYIEFNYNSQPYGFPTGILSNTHLSK